MESRFRKANASVGRCRHGERVSEGNVPFKILLHMLLVTECSNCHLAGSWGRKKTYFIVVVDTLDTVF